MRKLVKNKNNSHFLNKQILIVNCIHVREKYDCIPTNTVVGEHSVKYKYSYLLLVVTVLLRLVGFSSDNEDCVKDTLLYFYKLWWGGEGSFLVIRFVEQYFILFTSKVRLG